MKTSFLAITLAALFVTVGFAQTEQESASDAAVTTTTPEVMEAAPVEAAPIMAAPMMMTSPMMTSQAMPMSSCGCASASFVPSYTPMSSYVMPVTYQQPIVQQAQQPTTIAQTAQPAIQQQIQPTAQTWQQSYTQPSYYNTGYTQPSYSGYTQPSYYNRGCGCNSTQSVLATPISTPIVSNTTPIQQNITNVSAPISTPTVAQPITQGIGQTQAIAQPFATQQFATQPVTTGQAWGTTNFSGSSNYWQPQTVWTNDCCNNNSGSRFFNGRRVLQRRR